MKLADIGYHAAIDSSVDEIHSKGLQVGRVISEQKGRYSVCTAEGEADAEITGNLRYTARSREDFPAVGDWVLLAKVDSDFAVIHRVLPRYSAIKRQAPDQRNEIQIIAANIDYALIVQAADRDFNLNRLERYLAICGDSRIEPIIVITKIDLFEDTWVQEILARIRERLPEQSVFMLSNKTGDAIAALRESLVKGKTYCLLGSSGVGKSTLLNNLGGKVLMATGDTSASTGKGRHTTSYRELVVLDTGAILIDNPGMREVGLTESDAGFERAFSGIAELSHACRFSDCTHRHEKGCAVLEALHNATLDPAVYENFLKLEREIKFAEATAAERRLKDKSFGKAVKNYQKDKKMNKF